LNQPLHFRPTRLPLNTFFTYQQAERLTLFRRQLQTACDSIVQFGQLSPNRSYRRTAQRLVHRPKPFFAIARSDKNHALQIDPQRTQR
jgi:hypothetical protein